MQSAVDRRRALAAAGIATLLVTMWYALAANFLYGGNWTGLYCNGAETAFPQDIVREGLFQGPSKGGYDGQFYHLIAHDPLLQTDYSRYMFLPRIRYQRILIPGLAWLAAFGHPRLIDPMFVAVMVGFLALGVWWCARLCGEIGRNPYFGLLFLLLPGALITLDRFNVDIPLCAFAAGFAYYWRKRATGPLIAIAAAAPLARETGFVFPLALAAYFLAEKRWRPLLAACAAALPALIWFAFVAQRTPHEEITVWRDTFPLGWAFHALAHPQAYPGPGWISGVATTLDRAALVGTLLCLVLAARPGRDGWKSPVYFLNALFACAAAAIATVSSLDTWQDVFGYGRYVSPLILLAALRTLETGGAAGFLPWIPMAARAGIPLASQFLTMLRRGV
ncbi:MAG: hypothetical protein ACM336_19795 [Acidobacteriota bacterium]